MLHVSKVFYVWLLKCNLHPRWAVSLEARGTGLFAAWRSCQAAVFAFNICLDAWDRRMYSLEIEQVQLLTDQVGTGLASPVYAANIVSFVLGYGGELWTDACLFSREGSHER
jgi:hypothetical protein